MSPVLRSPSGIQADSPLQRACTSWAFNGSRRRKAAHVFGAASASQRAVNRSEPTMISSIAVKGKPDEAVRGLRVAEHSGPGVVLRYLRGVPEAVLRLEAHLAHGTELLEEASPHFVHEVLDRHADEIVEGGDDRRAHGLRGDVPGAVHDAVLGAS